MNLSAVNEFKDLCDAWQKDNFSDFCKIVGSHEVVGVKQNELAKQFKVASSTIYRWKTFQAHPHPFLQEDVVQYLKRKATTILKAEAENKKPAPLMAR